jgi:hypothetical protein
VGRSDLEISFEAGKANKRSQAGTAGEPTNERETNILLANYAKMSFLATFLFASWHAWNTLCNH